MKWHQTDIKFFIFDPDPTDDIPIGRRIARQCARQSQLLTFHHFYSNLRNQKHWRFNETENEIYKPELTISYAAVLSKISILAENFVFLCENFDFWHHFLFFGNNLDF